MKASYDRAVEQTVASIILSDTVNIAESDMLGGQRGVVLYSQAKNQAGADKARLLFRTRADAALDALGKLEALNRAGETPEIAARMRSGINEWRQVFAELNTFCEQGKFTEAIDLGARRGLVVYNAVGQDASRLTNHLRAELDRDKAAMADHNGTTRMVAITMVIIAAVAGVFVFIAIRRLCCTVRQVASDMDRGAQQVVSAATQVSQAAQMLAKTASEQAAALQQTSASSEQINAMASRNADDCRTAASLVGDSQQQFHVAESSLSQMVQSIHEISESSDKISNINKIIDGIAFQTNILALNAAVEAARAGEAGLGFAVVADEVRTLAQRCGEASRNTAQLIEESISRSHGGVGKVDAVGSVLKTLTEESTRIQSLVTEINEASIQQVNGTGEMNKAIGQMEKTTQQTAAYAEESASAAEELNSQAEILHQMVGQLTDLVGAR